MKRVFILVMIVFVGCSINKTQKIKVGNPNYIIPYVYKNGFHNFSIIPVLTLQKKDSVYVNELRFNSVFSAFYTQKAMFDEYGKWDEVVTPKGSSDKILVWNNIKLIKSDEILFSVAANGLEGSKEIYASVIVFDSIGKDCLYENYIYKDSIIDYFSDGIKNLSSNKKFYTLYWKTFPRGK